MATITSTPFIRHTNHNRIHSSNGEKKEIWSTLLNSVASSKRTPEKRLLVLGGSPESQVELIESLAVDPPPSQSRRQDRSKVRKIPIANQFALGYTYKDIYDADGEDILARLSFYTLPSPSASYQPLLTRLLTPASIPDTAVAILLDWSQPWTFVSLLRRWVQLLSSTLSALSADCQSVLEDNNTRWQRHRDAPSDPSSSDLGNDNAGTMPLGQGEFDEPLGLPLVIVVQNAQEVEKLEKERGYKEADFDNILQFLRTVGLKHGAGILYTMPSQPGPIKEMVLGRMLEIGDGTELFGVTTGRRGTIKKGDEFLKHNVVDRERVVVPLGWDSWGKIRVLREGFDIEGVSRAWSVDVQGLPEDEGADGKQAPLEEQADGGNFEQGETTAATSTEAMYAAKVPNPKVVDKSAPPIEVEHTDDQIFLAAQLERLEAFRAEDEAAKKQRAQTRRPGPADDPAGRQTMSEQIGPVQFNMGGIQYDADEALERIKEQAKGPAQPQGTPDRRTRDSTPFTPQSPPNFEAGKDIPVENLDAYFASLIKGGRGSVQNSPRLGTGSPRVTQKGTPEQGGRS